jgi:hypothetical protein
MAAPALSTEATPEKSDMVDLSLSDDEAVAAEAHFGTKRPRE